jgi:glutamate mutase epsilon subunit
MSQNLHTNIATIRESTRRVINNRGSCVKTQGSAANAIMQYSFLRVFANDRTIDAQELAMLEKLALSDAQVDDEERAVLARIFSRVNEGTVTADVWTEVCRFKQQHQIP